MNVLASHFRLYRPVLRSNKGIFLYKFMQSMWLLGAFYVWIASSSYGRNTWRQNCCLEYLRILVLDGGVMLKIKIKSAKKSDLAGNKIFQICSCATKFPTQKSWNYSKWLTLFISDYFNFGDFWQILVQVYQCR